MSLDPISLAHRILDTTEPGQLQDMHENSGKSGQSEKQPEGIARKSGHVRSDGIGARIERKEDSRHLLGRANFIADMQMHGMRELNFLRSPLAHARIHSITKPDGLAGDVVTADDLVDVKGIRADSSLPGYRSSEYPILARDVVRFVGEPIALCIADTRAEAEDVADQILLDLEPLPALGSVEDALRSDAVRIHSDWPDNLFLTTHVGQPVAEVAQRASVHVTRKLRTARQCMMPMEARAVMAWWEVRREQLIVYTSSQVPHLVRSELANALGIQTELLRVVSPDVGGGFGLKCVLQPEEIAVAWLAMQRRAPFRWVEDRREHLTAGANTRQVEYEITLHADDTGRILALEGDIAVDAGAYSVWPFTACLEAAQAGGNLPGPYKIEAYHCRTRSVATNKPPFHPYRGVARPGVCFAIELMIDALARAVGRDAAEVRHDNLIGPEQMPYTNVTGKHYDSGDYPRSLLRAMELIDLPALRMRQAADRATAAAPEKLLGVGFSTYVEQTAHGTKVFSSWGIGMVPGWEQATVRLTQDGGLELRSGVHSHGQGMETTLAQIAVTVLDIDFARVKSVLGDTGVTPFSTGTYASRSIVMAGGAVSRACKVLAERMRQIGAHLLQCDVADTWLEDGKVAGPGGSVGYDAIGWAWYLHPENLPDDVDPGGLEVTMGFKPAVDSGAFSYATHAVLVAVDAETGKVDILDYVVVEDCGTQVNPTIVEGQTQGGSLQGIGTALYEETIYDGSAQPITSTLADYLIPGAAEAPTWRMEHIETPSPYTEFGIKGVGEGGAIAPAGAVINAINDALAPLGAEITEAPATPRRIISAILAARPPYRAAS